MGCNCKVNEQILKIHKKHGYEINSNWVETTLFKVEEGVKTVLLTLLLLCCFPVFLIFFFMYVRKNKGIIKINKLLSFLLRTKNNE